MNVQNVIDRKGHDVVTIRHDATVKDAADMMHEHHIAALVVTHDGAVSGIVSERELVFAMSRLGTVALTASVQMVMQPGVVSVTPQDDVKRAMALMTHHRLRHLPVMQDGMLAGIISIGDVVKYRLLDLELEANVLRDAYIAAH